MKQSNTLTETALLRAAEEYPKPCRSSEAVRSEQPHPTKPPFAAPSHSKACTFVDVERDDAPQRIAAAIGCPSSGCVFLCIGTERVISDSLGPRVGTLLQLRMKKPLYVYGFCGSNVNALNLLAAHGVVRLLHPDKTLVVIDAAVGDAPEMGTVQVLNGPLTPGAATNKNLPNLGDISILAIVSRRGLSDFYTTGADRSVLVNKTAKTIAEGILLLN